jgi:NADPH:quinone reductase-like Zn-dependent oxidoreductase
MGYEVSGVVDAVGKDVNSSFAGKSVVAMTRFGGQSELIAVKATQMFEKPAQLTFEQAAAIPVNYLTAYALLVVMGSLHAGESVLIHNAGGGVGLAALDIAKKVGAETFGTASPGKHRFLAERGLDHAIDYRGQDWQPVLKELTNGRGVDLIIDPIGGSHWKKSFASLRHTGRLGMFGVSTASANGFAGKLKMLKAVIQTPWFHALPLLNRNRGVFGLNLGHMWHEPEKVAIWMRDILRGVDEGWVQPYVDQAFSFDEAGKAHQYLEARKNIGKVVLIP